MNSKCSKEESMRLIINAIAMTVAVVVEMIVAS